MMIDKKYLIMIGIAICLIILYYFYHEITKTKKSFLPAYQKIMSLENKVTDIEKKSSEIEKQLTKKKNPIDSTAYTITYNSEITKQKNSDSIRYENISDTEANKILEKIKGHPEIDRDFQIINEKATKLPSAFEISEKVLNIFTKSESSEIKIPNTTKKNNNNVNLQEILNNIKHSEDRSPDLKINKSVVKTISDLEMDKNLDM